MKRRVIRTFKEYLNESKKISVKLTSDNIDLIDFDEMDLDDIETLCSSVESMGEEEARKVFSHYELKMDQSMEDLDTWEDYGYDSIQEYICDMLYQTWESENDM